MLNYLKEINKKAKCLDLESHIRTNSTFWRYNLMDEQRKESINFVPLALLDSIQLPSLCLHFLEKDCKSGKTSGKRASGETGSGDYFRHQGW